MSTESFNWSNIRWEDFQQLTLHLAQNKFKDISFEEYLKPGNKQDGIDIISEVQIDGKYLVIQCKKEKTLSPFSIKKIIEQFKEGKFFPSTSRFIIATSADCQSVSLQSEIKNIKEELIHEYHITFAVWDRNFIQQQLKAHYTIVSSYFSPELADNFCFNENRTNKREKLTVVSNYINRSVRLHPEIENPLDWYLQKEKRFTLPELINNNRLNTKLICIIADAYQGKTLLMKQTAFDLQNCPVPFHPILIELKNYTSQPLKKILSICYGEWKNVPAKDIILLVDGLDEVPTDRFDETVRSINEFHLEYKYVSIVFSCRKIFYKHYKIKTLLPNFVAYDMVGLLESDISKYITNNLKSKASAFNTATTRIGVNGFLFHPFYLVNLVEIYKKDPLSMPQNKIGVIEAFIDSSLTTAAPRRLRNGYAIHERSVKYRSVIQKFAFTLQIAGLNALSKEQVQELFSPDEIELLQHNTLVTSNETSWSFTNAMFQEHLTALLLSKFTYNEIISFISVGNVIKKVKTKWLQTLASLMSMLDDDSTTFRQLVSFVEEDNIELFFMAEHTKFTKEFRLSITKKLLKEQSKKGLQPILVYEPVIAAFLDDIVEAKDYLITKQASNDFSLRSRITISRIIAALSLNEVQKKNFFDAAIKEIKATTDAYYANQLLEALAHFRIGNKHTIEKLLILNPALNNKHDFRDGIYQLAMAIEVVDDFYSYGLAGLPFLVAYNQEVHHGGSEYSFEEFLLSAKTWSKMKLLLQHIHEKDWLEYYTWRSTRKKEFFQKLTAKLVTFFESNPLIIFTIVPFVKEIVKKYIKEEFNELDEFFTNTESSILVSRLLYPDLIKKDNWMLAGLLSKESFDYLVFEAEDLDDPKLSIELLNNCAWGLSYNKKNEEAQELHRLAVAATEGHIINKNPSSHDEYLKHESLKRQNDLKYIRSIDAFKKGVINYFKAYGKKVIPSDDLYLDDDSKAMRKSVDSNLLFHFFYNYQRDEFVTLNKSIKILNSEWFFEYFRAKEIMKYNLDNSEGESFLIEILKQYYQETIKKANFRNCFWMDGNTFSWLRKEKLLAEIFHKHDFETPLETLIQLVWADDSNTRLFKKSEDFKEKKELSIAEMILRRLDENSIEIFKQEIVNNLKLGIKYEPVLGTHIALCMELRICEALGFVLDIIIKGSYHDLYMGDLIEVYIELGGDRSSLLPLLLSYTNYDDYRYTYLVKDLIEDHPTEVANSLLECLKSPETKEETKIVAAKHLSVLNYSEGFLYLASYIRLFKKAPYYIQGVHSIHNYDTAKGLLELTDLAYLIVDQKYIGGRFHDTAKNILLEWINGFAAKSEEDLNLVVNWLLQRQKELASSYELADDFFWYARAVVENFRNSDTAIRDFKQIRQILLGINN